MKLRKVSTTHDILFSEESQPSRNRAQILIGSKVYYRFMDVLYVPDHVYKLPPHFVAELNRVRDELSGVVIDPKYNEAVYVNLVDAAKEALPAVRTILDFGCGLGAAGPFIRRAFPAARVHGYDIRPTGSITPYADVSHGDATARLPYPDSSFDICFAFFVLHFHVPDHQIREIARTLRPGGAFAFNLINSADYEVLERIYESGFALSADLDIATTDNVGRGFVFLKELPSTAAEGAA